MASTSVNGSNIDIAYDTITTVATTLNTAATETIAPSLANLHTTVDNLLQQGGGLYMVQTSSAINAQYETFNSSATQCVSAIQSFATMFNTLVTNMQSMDNSLAYNIAHPSSS